MRPTERIDSFLEKFAKIWKANPDLRFGQLICNVIKDPALYYIEEDMLIDLLGKYYNSEIEE